jgi:hypothetical protein
VIRVNFLLSISDPMRLQGGGGGGGGEQEKSVNGASIACETDLKWCSNNSSSLFLFLFLFSCSSSNYISIYVIFCMYLGLHNMQMCF